LFTDFGVSKLKKNGSESSLFDLIGLSHGNASIGNFSLIEAWLANHPDRAHEHSSNFSRLHAYLGVKARALDALVDIH
jgi:hypothetical protein